MRHSAGSGGEAAPVPSPDADDALKAGAALPLELVAQAVSLQALRFSSQSPGAEFERGSIATVEARPRLPCTDSSLPPLA